MNPPPHDDDDDRHHHHHAADHQPYIPPTPTSAAAFYSLASTINNATTCPSLQIANPTTHYYPLPHATNATAIYPSYAPNAAVNHPPSSCTIPHLHSTYPLRFSDEDYVRRLRNEVIFLHSLWEQGPPNSGSISASVADPVGNLHLKAKPAFKKKKKRKNPQPRSVSDKPWPVPPEPPARPKSDSGWPEFCLTPAAPTRVASEEQKARILANRVQQKGLDCFRSFLAGRHGSESESGSEEDEDEEDDRGEFGCFLEVFEGNKELRGYYEKNWENGEFCCLVCGGIGEKVGRKFKNCVALIQHTVTIAKTKKRAAHRAYGQVICKVLGWDINYHPLISENPSRQQGNDMGNAESHKDDTLGVEANFISSVNNNGESDNSNVASGMGEDVAAEKKETSDLPSVLDNPGVQQINYTSNADTRKTSSDAAEENVASVLNVQGQADPFKVTLDSGDANAFQEKGLSCALTGREGDKHETEPGPTTQI